MTLAVMALCWCNSPFAHGFCQHSCFSAMSWPGLMQRMVSGGTDLIGDVPMQTFMPAVMCLFSSWCLHISPLLWEILVTAGVKPQLSAAPPAGTGSGGSGSQEWAQPGKCKWICASHRVSSRPVLPAHSVFQFTW